MKIEHDALRDVIKEIAQKDEQASHDKIVELLIKQVEKVEFREVIGLPAEENMKQKHIIYAIIKNLLNIAKINKWNLAKAYDYVYVFNGAYWKQFDKEQIRSFLGECAIQMGCPDYEAKQTEFMDKLLKQFLSDAFLLIPEPNEDEILINFKNGTGEVVNSKFTLRPFLAKDFITYQLPYNYDNTAVCPMFDKYLLRVLPDEQSRNLLQEFCGFIFTRLNIEKCLMIIGGGENGKSVFFNILNALIGKENVLNYPLGLFATEYNRSKLTNILLNYCSEKGLDLSADTFKTLISGEPMQAREPYGKPFTIRNRAKFIFNTNTLPKETEATEAYFRRFLVLPFEQKIAPEERDIDLADKIKKSELAGVFNWVLVGLHRIAKNRKFSECEKSKQAIEDFKKNSDSVQLFLEDENYTKSALCTIALKELHNSYKAFCSDALFKAVSNKTFASRLRAIGYEMSSKNYGTSVFIEKLEWS
jgi:putative DNA primase/helicase